MTHLALAIAALALSADPEAPVLEPEAQPNFVALRAGFATPRSSGFDHVDPGGDLELAVGRWFVPALGGELAVGWYSAEGDRISTAHDEMSFVPVTATVKVAIPLGRFRPYALGGGGAYWTGWRRTGGSSAAAESDSAWYLGGHVGAGFAIRISRRALLTAEGRYAFGEVDVLGGKQSANAFRLQLLGLGLAF